MQINNRAVQSYDANIQNGTRTENTKTTEQTIKTQSSAAISDLKEGAVFRAEVLNIVDDKITLSMEDKAQLLAKLQEGVQLGVGDQLLFSVKENTASQILIKPLFNSLYSAQTQVLERALDAAGLSPTEKNFSAAKVLMDAGMPVDKGNMVKLLSQSMKFEGTSMQTIVGLNKMNLPVTETNIAQYERYQGYQHQLTGDIAAAADAVASFTQAFPEGTSGNDLVSVANRILDMFISGQNVEDSMSQTMDISQNDMQNTTSVNGRSPFDASALAAESMLSAKPNVMAGEQVALHTSIEQNIPGQEKEIANLSGQKIAEFSADEVVQERQDGTKSAITLSQITESTGLTKEGVNHLTGLLSKAGMSGEQMQTLFQDSNSQEALLKNILQALSTTSGNEQAIRSVLDSNEFRNMLSEVVKRNWLLNPKTMKDPKEIDELYDKILKQSKSFENMITANGGESKQFEQSFQNMRQNMQFMEQLNNQMIYAQMPLKLTNQNANSELYVYADKRKLAQKKDGISVMLHLDMDNLGKTDVHVTLTGTNVNARFYLDDQDSVDIVTNHINQLAKQLADRGFSLTNEVVKRQPQESINKVVDEIIDENAERSIRRYTFDART